MVDTIDTINGSRTLALARTPKKFSGFTLIELLVVIAIIALLISIVLPGMAEARRLAYRVREMAAAEQKMVAYELYASENREAQFVGYAPWSVAHLTNQVGGFVLLHPDILYGGLAMGNTTDPDTTVASDQPVNAPAPAPAPAAGSGYFVEGNCIKINGMRFAGATQLNLEALMVDKKTFNIFNARNSTPSASNPGYSPPTNLYDTLIDPATNLAVKAAVIAYHPSLGLNTTFLGGSAHRGAFKKNGPQTKWGSDNNTRHYTTRTSDLLFPSKIMVMGSSRGVDVSSAGSYGAMSYGTAPPTYAANSVIVPGWWEIIPPLKPVVLANGNVSYQVPYNTTTNGTPQAGITNWGSTNPNDNKWDPNTDPVKWGFLDFRHKGLAVTAQADGHVEMASIKDLRDFRRWSNTAK